MVQPLLTTLPRASTTSLTYRPQKSVVVRYYPSPEILRSVRRVHFAANLLLFAIALPFLTASRQSPQQTPANIKNLTKDAAVAMRCGVILRVDVALPSASGRFPTLVYRTPYGKQFALKEGSTFEKAV